MTTTMWGFCQSTSVRVPVTVVFFVSKIAVNPWCAARGPAAHSVAKRVNMAKILYFKEPSVSEAGSKRRNYNALIIRTVVLTEWDVAIV